MKAFLLSVLQTRAAQMAAAAFGGGLAVSIVGAALLVTGHTDEVVVLFHAWNNDPIAIVPESVEEQHVAAEAAPAPAPAPEEGNTADADHDGDALPPEASP